MKKVLKKKNANLIIIFLVVILLLLVLIGIRFILNSNKSYKFASGVKTMEKYKKDNPDRKVMGWLKVQGTDIDYPILSSYDSVVGEDDDINYLWEIGYFEELNKINVILGHNILNLSSNPLKRDKNHTRFEQLPSFNYLDFASDNQHIQLTINNKDYVFKIFGVSYFDYGNISTYNYQNSTKEDVKTLIKNTKKNSIFDYSIDVNENDTIISLVTCTRMFTGTRNTGFKIDGRLLRKNEKTTNNKVVKNKNYKKVEERMKGGENNEV